ncbi:MAG: ABC transporter permease [Tannerellaceae bacterium]|jgi:putative ABC transport system permease protein|nr:ABC transporter permease [Tannerellaceae bacterium]
MIKIYFKQAIEMLKQNKFISLIAILGTALAIMMIMSIVVVDEIRSISIAPEGNRSHTYYIKYQRITHPNGWNSGLVDYDICRDYLSDLSTPDDVSLFASETFPVGKEGEDETVNAKVKVTDASFWKIMNFSFIEGKPFGQEEFESGITQAVVSEGLVKNLFKGQEALGQTLLVNYMPYRIVGIVKDVSPIFQSASGDVWIPATSQEGVYGYTILMLLEDKSRLPELEREIRNVEKKYDANNTDRELRLRGPDSHRESLTDGKSLTITGEEKVAELTTQYRKQLLIFLILLLVPAVNLSGLSFSRIKKRTAEIGVRKAFGAKKYIILIQVLFENLITSLIGGVVGLGLSYFAVFQLKTWLLRIPADSSLPGEAFVSFPVFAAVFIVCVLINLLSAGIPAWRASKLSIVNSLNENDK